MRIGFEAKRAFVNRTGLGNYSRNTIEQLHRYYPEVSLVLFAPQTNTSLFSPPDEVELIHPTGLYRLAKSLWRSKGMVTAIKQSKLDIFHGLSHELPFGLEKLAIRKIVTIHDLIFLRYPEFYKASDRSIYHHKFLRACKIADTIIAISEQTKQDIIQYFSIPESKIEVVYQSCNPDFFIHHPVDELELLRKKYELPAQFMLTVGNVDARKNLEGILRGMISAQIDFPLVVVGKPGTAWKEVQQLLSSYPKLPVIFKSNIDYRDLKAFYQLAIFSVYPSYFEGFGLPVLESMACGCPVITSNVSSMPEAGGPAARYISPGKPDEIGAAMRDWLLSDTLRNQFMEGGLTQAALFTPKASVIQLMKVYTRS